MPREQALERLRVARAGALDQLERRVRVEVRRFRRLGPIIGHRRSVLKGCARILSDKKTPPGDRFVRLGGAGRCT